MISLTNVRTFRDHRLALALVVCLTACPTPRAPEVATQRKNPDLVTSAELVAAGERDTVYVRRIRMFEEIAATIRTDSLARIMTGIMDAPAEQEPAYLQALMCEYHRMSWQYGAIAPERAINRTEDSLFAIAGVRKRWLEAQKRFPMFGTFDPQKCDVSGLPHAPDSLNNQPYKTVWP
jgi:hypothetical protein